MMIPTIKNAPTLFAALTATALLVFQPSLASARTTLQLDNGNVLSFSDGSIDMVYWLFGCQALHAVGGTPQKNWDKAVDEAIVG
ncbi:MAG: hypothetical protein ACPF9Y_04470, partial [Candidatus Puniceispirillaceae bacterium]